MWFVLGGFLGAFLGLFVVAMLAVARERTRHVRRLREHRAGRDDAACRRWLRRRQVRHAPRLGRHYGGYAEVPK